MRLLRRTILCLVVGVMGMVAIYFIQRPPARRSLQSTGGTIENVQALFGGQESLEVVRGAVSVAASRIVQPESNRPTRVPLNDYQVAAGPVVVPPEIMTELQAVLLAPNSYVWKYTTSCI